MKRPSLWAIPSLAALACLLATSLSFAAPSAVLVKSRELGQGLLAKRADTCYLLTAAHVVGDFGAASLVGSVGTRRLGEARLVARFPALDLALLRVSGALAMDCGDDLNAYRVDLSRVLSLRPQGSLPFVFDSNASGGAGGLGRLPVVVTDLGPDWLRVAPTRSGDTIEQGRSGSVVLISDGGADRAAGLLVSVGPGGEGKVLRLDRALALLDEFFANPAPFIVPTARPAASATPSVGESPGNLLSAAAGASVARWSALPSSPEFSPSNLVDGRSAHSWNAAARQWPVDVDLRFADAQAQTIGRIELVLAGDQPPSRAAREIEVLTSMDGNSWRSIHTGTLFSDEAVKVLTMAPQRAAWLRLRIYQNWGDPDWVSLRQVRAFKE